MKALHTLFSTDQGIAALVLRVVLGVVFFPHGAQKVFGWFGGYGDTGTMGFFTQVLGIPAFFGFLAIVAEFAGAIALVFGFMTRLAAFGIAVTMAVAMATVHWQYGFFMNWFGKQAGEGYQFDLLVIAMGVALKILGGGRWSADRSIAQRLDNAILESAARQQRTRELQLAAREA